MEPEIELGQLFYSSMPEKENDRREKVEMREGERKKKKNKTSNKENCIL